MTKEQARERNWMKARLMGAYINFGKATGTLEEMKLLSELNTIRQKLLDNWDENSYALSGKPMPKYKCWCGKRTNVFRKSKYSDINKQYSICKKHWKEEQKEDN